MFFKLKNQIHKIQNSEDSVKRRWMIGSSAVAMIIVIILWLFYMSATIKPVEEVKVAEEQNAENSAGDFWPVFKNGLSVTGDAIKKQINDLMEKIKSEQSMTIEKGSSQ